MSPEGRGPLHDAGLWIDAPVLASTALVWLMIPGVGFFYSGLLRRKNAAAYRSVLWSSSRKTRAGRSAYSSDTPDTETRLRRTGCSRYARKTLRTRAAT